MKFKVREGFVVKIVSKIDLGDGQFEMQEFNAYGGQIVELDAAQAEQHTHKLEPVGKDATAFVDAKVLPASPAAAMGVSAEALALAQAMAAAMVKEIVGQVLPLVQTSAQPAAQSDKPAA